MHILSGAIMKSGIGGDKIASRGLPDRHISVINCTEGVYMQ